MVSLPSPKKDPCPKCRVAQTRCNDAAAALGAVFNEHELTEEEGAIVLASALQSIVSEIFDDEAEFGEHTNGASHVNEMLECLADSCVVCMHHLHSRPSNLDN